MTPATLGVLDTSVVIDMPSNLPHYAVSVSVPAVAVGELSFGLHVAADPVKSAEREQRYRDILATYDPLPYDATAAHWYGAIAAAVRRKGRNPRPRMGDLMIAATARSIGGTVLTRNPDDFKGLDGIVQVLDVR
ncbi:MAG: PIN domain-containing protein [Actinomycetia bacterium]|nr:PIN domain-containing protein [Actinomycetes bacterium]